MLKTTTRLDRYPSQIIQGACGVPQHNSVSTLPNPFPWLEESVSKSWESQMSKLSCLFVIDRPTGEDLGWGCDLGTGTGWVLEDSVKPAVDLFSSQVQKHQEYLQGLVKEGLISPGLEAEAIKAWWRLSAAVDGDLAVPDAAPGGDGELFYIWKSEDHYLSLEMSDTGADFFYQDRQTGKIWGTDYNSVSASTPGEIVAKLRLFSVVH